MSRSPKRDQAMVNADELVNVTDHHLLSDSVL